MKILNTILILLFCNLLSAQVDPFLTDAENRFCGFPDNGYAYSSNSTNRAKDRGGTIAFEVGGKYFYHTGGNSGNQQRFPKILKEVLGSGISMYDDLTVGYTFNNEPINVMINAANNAWKYDGNGIGSVKVRKYEGGTFKDVPFYSAWANGANDGKKELSKWEVKFNPEQATVYQISGTVEYYWFEKELYNWSYRTVKKSHSGTFRFYICVSGPGGYNGNRTYTPKISKQKLCNHTLYSIANKDRVPGYTYYWSNNPDPTKWEQANVIKKGEDFYVTKEDLEDERDFYVYGRIGSYFSEVVKMDNDVITRPKPPTFTGNYLQCDCKLEFTGEPGEGGDQIRWAYYDNSNNLKFIDSDQGISNKGKSFVPSGQLEGLIKQKKELFMYSYQGFFQNNAIEDGYDADEYCISSGRKVKFETAPCQDCETNFLLKKGEKYVVSAWVKEKNNLGKITYSSPKITLKFEWQGGEKVFDFYASGNIIDGWQKIEEAFEVPVQTEKMTVIIECEDPSSECYFDDIRLFNFNGSMVSYVYDPVTLQLKAKLDNNNMYIMYNYDEEGNLVGTKVETLDGVRSVNETRTHIKRALPTD